MNSRAVINVGVATFSLTVVLSGFWEKQRAVSAGSGESFRSLQGFATSLTLVAEPRALVLSWRNRILVALFPGGES